MKNLLAEPQQTSHGPVRRGVQAAWHMLYRMFVRTSFLLRARAARFKGGYTARGTQQETGKPVQAGFLIREGVCVIH